MSGIGLTDYNSVRYSEIKMRKIGIVWTTLILFCTINAMAQVKNEKVSKELLEAARGGNDARIRELVKADPAALNEKDDAGETPILAALFQGHQETVALLVTSGTRLNLFEAACLGNLESVAALLKAEPQSINSKGFGGATALHFAAFLGHREVVRALLQKKAEVNLAAAGFGNATPLHSAVANNHLEIAEMLIAKGAKVDARQAGGLTPLHETALAGHKELAELLIRKGADVNLKDDRGRTALAIAIEKNRPEVAKILWRRGARQ
jgi:uncharacterized protein